MFVEEKEDISYKANDCCQSSELCLYVLLRKPNPKPNPNPTYTLQSTITKFSYVLK